MPRTDSRAASLLLAVLIASLAGCAATGACGRRECPDEAALRRQVEAQLDGYADLRPPNLLYVQVRGHQVTLSGQVASDYARSLAESVAGAVPGVERVVDFIAVLNNPR